MASALGSVHPLRERSARQERRVMAQQAHHGRSRHFRPARPSQQPACRRRRPCAGSAASAALSQAPGAPPRRQAPPLPPDAPTTPPLPRPGPTPAATAHPDRRHPRLVSRKKEDSTLTLYSSELSAHEPSCPIITMREHRPARLRSCHAGRHFTSSTSPQGSLLSPTSQCAPGRWSKLSERAAR